jgi:AcrR family transcriptional regulator
VKTDQRIVRAMAELLRVQGYGSTGVQQLAQAAGAPTGSIYHHFRGGKREVAAAALRETGAAYIELLPLLLDPHADLAAGVEAAFAAAAEDMAGTGWVNMCPVGTVAGEIADIEPELRQVAAEVIESWVDIGTSYLTGRGLPHAHARTAIYALLAALEGGFLLARAQRTTEPLLAAGRAVASYVATLPVVANT